MQLRKQLSRAARYVSDPDLIRVDRRVVIVCAIALFVLVIGTIFNIHGSSVGRWNVAFGNDPRQGVLVGSPKDIRSDEWYALTPVIIGQTMRLDQFGLEFDSAGGEHSPMLLDLPVRHITTIARPFLWPYFIFSVERAFSAAWLLTVVGVFMSSFAALLLLTRNRFWLSLFGAGWLFASSFTQWWFSTTLPELLTATCLLFVAAVYLLYARKTALIITAGIIAVLSATTFAIVLYPPWQVSLAYLLIALFVGYVWTRRDWRTIREHLVARVVVAVLTLATLAGLGWAFVHDAGATIELVRQTVYPGSRVGHGGGVTLDVLAAPLFNAFMREGVIPSHGLWSNVVELSGFILAFPLAFIMMAYRAIKRARVTPLEWALGLYIVLALIWMTIGAPPLLERVTGLSLATNLRMLAGLGVASILLCLVVLSRLTERMRLSTTVVTVVVIAVAYVCVAQTLRGVDADFYSLKKLLFVGALIVVGSWMYVRRHTLGFAALILAALVPHLGINPIAYGLSPILNLPLVDRVREMYRADPEPLWIVFSNDSVANAIKVTGASVLNGVQYAPHLDWLAVLDPQQTSAHIWNRYARINVEPVTDRNAVSFTRTSDASYTMYLNPCNPALEQLNVEYFVFWQARPDYACLELLTPEPLNGAWIARRR